MHFDGVLEEWSDAQMVPVVYPSGFSGENADDLKCEVGFMWDEDYLYLAVRTEDNEYHQPYAGRHRVVRRCRRNVPGAAGVTD